MIRPRVLDACGRWVVAMSDRKRDESLNERLDRVGRELLRTEGAAGEPEAQRVSDAPFLYARVRSRIRAEQERHEEGERWRALLGVVWRAAPAMTLVTIFAFLLFWSTNLATGPASNVSVESLIGTRDAEIEQVVFADNQPLSSDEVLVTILNEDETGGAR